MQCRAQVQLQNLVFRKLCKLTAIQNDDSELCVVLEPICSAFESARVLLVAVMRLLMFIDSKPRGTTFRYVSLRYSFESVMMTVYVFHPAIKPAPTELQAQLLKTAWIALVGMLRNDLFGSWHLNYLILQQLRHCSDVLLFHALFSHGFCTCCIPP